MVRAVHISFIYVKFLIFTEPFRRCQWITVLIVSSLGYSVDLMFTRSAALVLDENLYMRVVCKEI